MVQSVYILERDRQEKRDETRALAPPWWKSFDFQIYKLLVDNADRSIFGAIFQLAPTESVENHGEAPRYVIAFRGTITKGDAVAQDIELNVQILQNRLHQTPRFEAAIQAVRHVVATFGSSNVWLAGHSLGAAMAMLAGKTTARTGVLLESFLFNPPFVSAPIERIQDKKVKHGIRFAGSVITAGLALASKNRTDRSSDASFTALAAWVPGLFVNPADDICSEYVGYFEHRKRMEDMGVGAIERLATQHSIGGFLMNALGRPAGGDPVHLIPSATVSVNRSPARDFKDAHGIHQWWREDLRLDTKTYTFK
ncbi:GDSL esterase/lipase At4g10955 isoform X2 [Andrographis paniculata]|nr:GDSL esterase/lipase At4g10955 isoform X2 [Andrographis paniculata]XP_051130090.1 GDSL esterase/lipase At4g10955 isoform X2 [Andrographis paniculata]